MIYRGTYLQVATVLGEELVPVSEAIAAGAYTHAAAARSGQRSVAVSAHPGPDLAVHAGRLALAGAGLDTVPDLHLHAVLDRHPRWWSAATYVRRQLGAAGAGMSMEIGAMSNGVCAAVELAATVTAVRPGCVALVTAGERFGPRLGAAASETQPPAFDRWQSDGRAAAYGD